LTFDLSLNTAFRRFPRPLSEFEAVSALEVYRTTDTKLGCDVALKVLPSECLTMPKGSRAFAAKAKTAQIDGNA